MTARISPTRWEITVPLVVQKKTGWFPLTMNSRLSALAHIVATELEQIANEDERNGVRSMCNVLRARAAALRSTIQNRLVARAHESGFLRHAAAVAAIRAVLAGHEPYVDYEEQRPYCRHCYDSDGDSRPWPCATVSAITKALGIAEETT